MCLISHDQRELSELMNVMMHVNRLVTAIWWDFVRRGWAARSRQVARYKIINAGLVTSRQVCGWAGRGTDLITVIKRGLTLTMCGDSGAGIDVGSIVVACAVGLFLVGQNSM